MAAIGSDDSMKNAAELLGFEVMIPPEDVVEILGLERTEQIYELIRPTARCPLPYVRVGKYLRFKPSALREWIEANTSAARKKAK
jgi:predicted DNA-binding transcriptional regulator AlpA